MWFFLEGVENGLIGWLIICCLINCNFCKLLNLVFCVILVILVNILRGGCRDYIEFVYIVSEI